MFVTLSAAAVLVLVPEGTRGEAFVSNSCLADIFTRQFNVARYGTRNTVFNRFSFLANKIIEKHYDENNLSQP